MKHYTVALFINPQKQSSCDLAKEIATFLKAKKFHITCADDYADLLGASPLSSQDKSRIDFVITIGGDGTILHYVHSHPEIEAPVIGVNLGTLGFLADIPVSDVYNCLEEIFAGNYDVQDRMMISGRKKEDKTSCFALNEVAIHRGKNPSLVDVAIHVDGDYFNTFSADGVIISTPSGSTAYSLASGGPILTPELKAFVITPISPHTISNRPIVLMPKKCIEVQYIDSYEPLELTYDGISTFSLKPHETFCIQAAKRKLKLISLKKYNYFAALRSKLGWIGTLKQ